MSTESLRDEQAADADGERYRLLSVETANAPEGCTGRDWFVYRIAQGSNEITGYRQGKRDAVNAEVAAIVTGLNGRRTWAKPTSKAQRRAASQIRLGDAS